MQVPLQVSFRDMEHSEAVEALAREKAAALEKFAGDLTSCRVVVGPAGKHRRRGNPYEVRIDLAVPGREIAVTRGAGPGRGARGRPHGAPRRLRCGPAGAGGLRATTARGRKSPRAAAARPSGPAPARQGLRVHRHPGGPGGLLPPPQRPARRVRPPSGRVRSLLRGAARAGGPAGQFREARRQAPPPITRNGGTGYVLSGIRAQVPGGDTSPPGSVSGVVGAGRAADPARGRLAAHEKGPPRG
jgi:hypothetical protein